MLQANEQNDIIKQLQREVLSLQGFKRVSESQSISTGLQALEASFPDKVFPVGAIHEFISPAAEEAAATNGFITGLLSCMVHTGGTMLWISTKKSIFPPALKVFGIEPEHIIFIDTARQKEALWAIEEGLKCEALSAVVGEISELSFNESRRLQLVVEQSHVTGFIHRYNPKSWNTVACVTRWEIKPLISLTEDIPGVGIPRWNVQLHKVRNGIPGVWQIEWSEEGFKLIPHSIAIHHNQNRKAG